MERKQGGRVTHVVINRRSNAGDVLRCLLDQRSIVMHVWLAQVDEPERPDRLIFDLDPPDGGFRPVVDGARALREALTERGIVPTDSPGSVQSRGRVRALTGDFPRELIAGQTVE